MANEQVMIDTVKRMLEAGIDEPTVVSTLAEAGLSQEDALNFVQKVKVPAPQVQPISQPPVQQSDIQAVRDELNTQADVQDMQHAAVHNKLDIHEQKIDEVSQKIDEVKEAVSSAVSPSDGALSMRISNLEHKLEEVSSVSKANLDLLQKILENNSKILTELESKK